MDDLKAVAPEMKMYQEPKEYTEKLARMQMDFKENSERKEVSGSPQQ
jgi:hypothetical protein